jgi:hypothetical protein
MITLPEKKSVAFLTADQDYVGFDTCEVAVFLASLPREVLSQSFWAFTSSIVTELDFAVKEAWVVMEPPQKSLESLLTVLEWGFLQKKKCPPCTIRRIFLASDSTLSAEEVGRRITNAVQHGFYDIAVEQRSNQLFVVLSWLEIILLKLLRH